MLVGRAVLWLQIGAAGRRWGRSCTMAEPRMAPPGRPASPTASTATRSSVKCVAWQRRRNKAIPMIMLHNGLHRTRLEESYICRGRIQHKVEDSLVYAMVLMHITSLRNLHEQDAATPLPKSWRSVGSGGDTVQPALSTAAAQPVLAEIGDLWQQVGRWHGLCGPAKS